MTDISKQVQEWRKANGLSQASAAERLGIRQGTLSRIEAGQRAPSLSLAMRMVEAGALPADFAAPKA